MDAWQQGSKHGNARVTMHAGEATRSALGGSGNRGVVRRLRVESCMCLALEMPLDLMPFRRP